MKKLIALVLALAMTLALAACGSKPASSPGESAAPSNSAPEQAAETPAGEPAGEPADDTVYELIVQNHDPSTSICAQFLEDWGALVEEASGNRIKFIFYHGGSLGGAGETVDMVLNGQADLGWTAASINVGRFPCTDGITLPLLGYADTVEASKAMWYMYCNHDYISDEWSDFHVIYTAAACDVPIATNTQINTVSDFSGLRIRAGVPGVVYLLEELGAAPVSFSISDTYENLEKHVADGCMNDWHNMNSLNLWDVVDYVLDSKTYYSNNTLIMNKDSYNKLPADLQAILDEYSGEFAALMAGEYWERSVSEAKEAAQASGTVVYEPSAEVAAAIENAADVAREKWAKDLDADGYDGSQIVADYLEAKEAVAG